ncbi:DNA cytosine methyltransferase [Priestia aryabhattai]
MTNINEVKEILTKKILEEKNIEGTVEHPYLYSPSDKVTVVSLFSGAGGLDLGIEHAGINIGTGMDVDINDEETYKGHRKANVLQTIYALDNFKEALISYEENFEDTKTHKVDIRKLKHFPKADVYTFGFPCPGFSAAGPRLVDDKRNFLYIHCCRALLEAQPKVFIAENVKGMMSLGEGKAYEQIKEDFAAAGYRVYTKLINSRDYGVPQLRERVFLIGVRNDLGFEYEFPKPTHGEGIGLKPFVTLRDAIGDLEDNPGMYYEGSYSSKYMGRNRKKSWDDQSFTIQASGRHAPIHPAGDPMEKIDSEHWRFPNGEQNERRFSTREAACVQTFPEWFIFDGGNFNVSHNTMVDKIFKQIGNAVPVKLATILAEPIVKFLWEEKEKEIEAINGLLQRFGYTSDSAVEEDLSLGDNEEEINSVFQEETSLVNNEEEINLIDRFGQFAFDF